MCGIVGVLTRKEPTAIATAQAMSECLLHRGPDFSSLAYVPLGSTANMRLLKDDAREKSLNAIAHRRLAIIDVSETGNQPMRSDDGRFWIVYNGEVYNYLEIREELKGRGYSFRSHSDTEVVLKSFQHWGPDCFSRFNGMWSLAIFDSAEQQLTLARDHFGIKPLYYASTLRGFVFASEIAAILRSGFVEAAPQLTAISDFLLRNTTDHASHTFFKGITQIPPGSYAQLRTAYDDWKVEPRHFGFSQSTEAPAHDFDGRVEQVRALLQDSINIRLRSDVPIGACLSGGLDSSGIVAIVDGILNQKSHQRHTVHTFTAFYPSEKYDEKPFVDALSRKISLDQHFTSPSGADVAEALEKVVGCQQEPFGGAGIVSQWFVFKLAHEAGLKVMLDGQGADELFAGYLTFFGVLVREHLSKGRYLRAAVEAATAGWHHSYVRDSLGKLRSSVHREAVFARLGKHRTPAVAAPGLLLEVLRPEPYSEARDRADVGESALKDACFRYLTEFSLPALLRYEDRNSMHFSVESRLPYLDPRLVQYAHCLQDDDLMRYGTTKRVLRGALDDLLPKEISQRKLKLGFSTPEIRWLREDLRPIFTELFESKSFAERGMFDAASVRRQWSDYLHARRSDSSTFWKWGILELWFRRFID